ncbi:uncharacterized protein LOC114791167 [Denticeps clupeoides]|uniref:uncharacterized protein LOC114791167 n=1 Tax=Denticeps clupeoides TaxID=299321 RepID=UPI0010A40857|nr:uncharacterized protein LOC114791167 [Denticeps clupeoides]
MVSGMMTFTALHFIFGLFLLMEAKANVRHNMYPCKPSNRSRAHDTFLKRHLHRDAPTSLNHTHWHIFIKEQRFCQRHTQSFLPQSQEEQVKSVCSESGGFIHSDNMCISKKPFSFITARINTTTCSILTVQKETKHLLLSCDKIEGRCVPVHFQGNPDNTEPDHSHHPCEDPEDLPQVSAAAATSSIWKTLLFFLSWTFFLNL